MGVLVDEQATISNSVQTASSPAHQERTVNGRWGTGVWGMEWAEYTGNTPRRKDQGWAKWLPNKRPSRSGEGRVNLAEAVTVPPTTAVLRQCTASPCNSMIYVCFEFAFRRSHPVETTLF